MDANFAPDASPTTAPGTLEDFYHRFPQCAYELEEEAFGSPISELRRVFLEYIRPNQTHSRGGWVVLMDACDSDITLLIRAAKYFHADEADILSSKSVEGSVLVLGNGYQA